MTPSRSNLREIARKLGGEAVGGQVLCPGPGHSLADRSLSVKPVAGSLDGFVAHSFAGDDWRSCREHVARRLGIAASRRRDTVKLRGTADVHTARADADVVRVSPRQYDNSRIALPIWANAIDPRGTFVEAYWRSRELELNADIACSVIRYHPHCPWGSGADAAFVPAMIALYRAIDGDEPRAIMRTRLTQDGAKVGRAALGPVGGAAIKLDGDDSVLGGLFVAEGVETAQAARQLGMRPCWALGSTSGIRAFPVLSGIGALTMLVENDGGKSAEACAVAAERWQTSGREVFEARPLGGKDLNDAIMRGAA